MKLVPLALAVSLLSMNGLSRAEGVASSASSAGSASVGSISGSLEHSSDSSNNRNQVAEGEYRIIDVAASATHPDMLRVALHGAAEDFVLVLPRLALAQRALAAEDVVHVSHRPYGLAFAYADTREDFFLVLADDWRRDIDPRPVTL